MSAGISFYPAAFHSTARDLWRVHRARLNRLALVGIILRIFITPACALQFTWNSPDDVPLSVSQFNASLYSGVFTLNFDPEPGAQLTAVNVTDRSFIIGRLSNLSQGQEVVLPHNGINYHFIANYYGGTGNDLILVLKGAFAVAWGNNVDGQLGDGTKTQRNDPTTVDATFGTSVLSGRTVLALSSGGGHSLALCSDGIVAAWGANTSGQLGNGTFNASTTPAGVAQDSGGSALIGKTVVAVAAGQAHSLALCSDGTIAAWGANEDGQLGDASNTDRPIPVLVSNNGALSGRTVVGIAAGERHSLALCSDGSVVAWGGNDTGQLGNGSNESQNTPVLISTLGVLFGKSVVAVAAGANHCLALCSDGTIAAWGTNSDGQLGDGTTSQRLLPVKVSSDPGISALAGLSARSIAAGGNRSMALGLNGHIVAWGENSSGQLGDGTTVGRNLAVDVETSPGLSALNGKQVQSIGCGRKHTVARCTDGTIAVWGANNLGQLGISVADPQVLPTLFTAIAPGDGHRWMQLFAASCSDHCLAQVGTASPAELRVEDSNGQVLSDGSGTIAFGVVNAGDSAQKTITIRNTGGQAISGINVDVTNLLGGDFAVSGSIPATLASGASATLTLQLSATGLGRRSGRLSLNCSVLDAGNPFDIDLTGQVSGTLQASWNSPTDVPLSVTTFSGAHSVANFALQFAPEPGTQLTVVENTGIAFNESPFDNLMHGQSVTLTYDGQSFEFVANYYGGTGNDLVLVWKYSRAYAWGTNLYFQNPGSSSPVPARVLDTGALSERTVLQVAGGKLHSLFVLSDGSLASWGQSGSGILGINNPPEIPAALAVPVNMQAGVSALAGKTVVSACAGRDHSVALCSDGTVASWGSGSLGQLAGGGIQSNVPVAPFLGGSSALQGRSVVAIAAGDSHTLALCSDGTIVAWGLNTSGQLGIGNFTSTGTPTAVSTQPGASVLAGKSVIAIAAGAYHSLALCSDGTVACWGRNTSGQLGDSTTTNRAYPVTVDTTAGVSALSGRVVRGLSAGDGHSLALCSDGRLVTWGANSLGQLGDTTSTSSLVPVLVNSEAQTSALDGRIPVAVGGGKNHSHAVCSDGALVTWGAAEIGLGDGSSTESHTPVLVAPASLPAGSRFTSIMTSPLALHSIAVVGLPASPSIFVLGPKGGKTVDGLSRGDLGSCGVGAASNPMNFTVINTGNADLILSGIDVDGANADEFLVSTLSSSVIPPGGSESFTVTFSPGSVGSRAATVHVHSNAAGNSASYDFELAGTAFDSLSAAYATGDEIPLSARGIAPSGTGVTFDLQFDPSPGTHLMVAKNTGSYFITGTFANLQQGQTVVFDRNGVFYEFVADYFGGDGNDLVLNWKDSKVFAWGRNHYGQLGDGTINNRSAPVAVANTGALANRTVLRLAVGATHSLALCADGTVAAWGRNTSGQLGDGTTTDRPEPVLVNSEDGVSDLHGRLVVAVAAGKDHSLALCSDGTVVAWGSNTSGALGSEGLSTAFPRAVDVTPGVSALAGRSCRAIAAGDAFSLALTTDDRIVSWGSDSAGQLGNGVVQGGSTFPVDVSTMADESALFGASVNAIAAGTGHALALTSTGSVISWGSNTYSQLGAGVAMSLSQAPLAVTRTFPTPLSGRTVVKIAAGGNDSLALCSDGTVVNWGHLPTFGGPSLVSMNYGSPPLSQKTVLSIAAGAYQEMSLFSDGALAMWGQNNYGQLGDSTTSYRGTPALVSTGGLTAGQRFSGIQISSGGDHSLALVASPPAPVIAVESSVAGALADGTGIQTFGTVGTRSESVAVTITIRNQGTAALSGLDVIKDGACADEFELDLSGMTATVAPGESTNFQVVFKPVQIGPRLAALHISSNVTGNESPFDIPLAGTGVAGATGTADILVQPVGQIIAKGGTLTLQVAAQGEEPLHYQWRRNGANLSQENGASLQLPNIGLSQAGAYSCVVSNLSAGVRTTVASYPVEVVVVDASARQITARLNSVATLTTDCAGRDLSFQWLHGNDPVPNAGGKTLKLGPLVIDASGDYVCRVISPVGTLDAGPLTLAVFDSAPSILLSDLDALPPAMVGDTYAYEVPVDASVNLTPSRFAATGLPNGLKIDAITGLISGKPTVSKTAPFQITLTASNAAGRSTRKVLLLVSALPEGLIGNYTSTLGRDATLNKGLGGRLDLSTTKSGAFTGKLALGDKTHSFAGKLETDLNTPSSATGSATVSRHGQPPLDLQFSLSSNNGTLATATLTDGVATLAFSGWRNVWNKSHPASALAGQYTVSLDPPDALRGDPGFPQGTGFVSFAVSATSGRVTVSGRLSDGTAVAWTTFVGPGGQVAAFKTMYAASNRGSIVGTLLISSSVPSNSNTVGGHLSWHRPSSVNPKERYYAAGFLPTDLTINGARYVAPAAPDIVLNLDPSAPGNARLTFTAPDGGDIQPSPSPNLVFTIGKQNKVTPPVSSANPRKTTLSLSASKGTFSGSFTMTDASPLESAKRIIRKGSFQGVFIQQGPLSYKGYGFCLLPELPSQVGETPANTEIRSGRVVLEPATALP